METPTITIHDLGEYGHIDEDGNVVWHQTSIDPVETRLAALELQVAELSRKLDNLTAYVRVLMTHDQRLRCAIPHRE